MDTHSTLVVPMVAGGLAVGVLYLLGWIWKLGTGKTKSDVLVYSALAFTMIVWPFAWLAMLRLLDPQELSRFAIVYFGMMLAHVMRVLALDAYAAMRQVEVVERS